MAGRKPLPTAIKQLQGTIQKCRLNKDEPTPEVVELACPAEASDGAREYWPGLERQLRALGVLTVADESALLMLCESFAEWQVAMDGIQEHGLIVKQASGNQTISPYCTIAGKAHDRILRLLTEFGMTPSSRSRVSKAPSRKKENRFLNRK